MKKENIYKLTIAILLVLNLLQLGSFLLAPSPSHRGDKFAKEAVKIMQLNASQQRTFLHFVEQHRQAMRQVLRLQTQVAEAYFEQPSDSLLKLIADAEIQKVSITQRHFSDIKSLLTPEQLPFFEMFKKKALQAILRKNHHFDKDNKNAWHKHKNR